MGVPEEILDRVRKLLRLADSQRGATGHEARLALAKAHELMVRYNIDSVALKLEPDTVESVNLELPRRLRQDDLLILSLLQAHFHVRIVLLGGAGGTPADILGSKADVTFALYVYAFLKSTFASCWKSFRKLAPMADRKSYLRGLHDGLDAALKKARAEAESAFSRDTRKRYELVLVAQEEAVTRFMEKRYGQLRKRRTRRSRVNSESYLEGQQAGAQIRIRQPLENCAPYQ